LQILQRKNRIEMTTATTALDAGYQIRFQKKFQGQRIILTVSLFRTMKKRYGPADSPGWDQQICNPGDDQCPQILPR